VLQLPGLPQDQKAPQPNSSLTHQQRHQLAEIKITNGSSYAGQGAALHQMPGFVGRTQTGFHLPPVPFPGFFVLGTSGSAEVGGPALNSPPVWCDISVGKLGFRDSFAIFPTLPLCYSK
jgi:hypothetical protein